MIEPNCQPLRAGSPACLRRVERLGGGYGGPIRAVDLRSEWLEGLPSLLVVCNLNRLVVCNLNRRNT